MQLVGIGLSGQNWNALIKQLQIHFSHQLNTKLYEVANSASETKNWLKDTENLSQDILKHNPDCLLFSQREIESAENCLDLLDKVQRKSTKWVSFVMVIQSTQDELHSILAFNPMFELVNNMSFKISTPELILNHHIPRFPRIALNAKFQVIEYISDLGKVVKHTPNEIPLNTLIPFKNIRKIHTNKDQLSPIHSVEMLLSDHIKIADPKQVVGILREAKGCYFFPGIPFNSIKNIKINKTKIEYLIKLDECNENNPPFKRLIQGLIKKKTEKHKKNKTKINQSSPQILCLCRYRIINNLMKKLLKGIGYANTITVERIDPEDENLKYSDVLLKLHDCNGFAFKGQIIDWSKELDKIVEPLSQFVFLKNIESTVNSKPLPIKHDELEVLKEKLLGKEKTVVTMNMHAESDLLIYSQEYNVLKKIEHVAILLGDALSSSTNWTSAFRDPSKIRLQRALLLCENENDASEMNFKLTNVQRKLWVNPFSIQKPEDLTRLKSKTILSYFNPGSLIIKHAALRHLKKICLQTKQEIKNSERTLKRQKEILKKTKSELKLVHSNKNKLALSWMEINLKELLSRDIQLLKLNSFIAK